MMYSYFSQTKPLIANSRTLPPTRMKASVSSQIQFGKILALEGAAKNYVQGFYGSWYAFDPKTAGRQYIYFVTPNSRDLIDPLILRKFSDPMTMPFAPQRGHQPKDFFTVIDSEEGRLLRAYAEGEDVWLVDEEGKMIDIEKSDPQTFRRLNARLKTIENYLADHERKWRSRRPTVFFGRDLVAKH